MNKNPAWKYLLLVVIVALGIVYAFPNLFGDDMGVQVIGLRNTEVNQQTLSNVDEILRDNALVVKSLSLDGDTIKARLTTPEDQLRAQSVLKDAMGNDYGVALALLPSTPDWLNNLGAAPMYLGLDLRGGVHFLLEVDMQSAQLRAEENYIDDIRKALQAEKIRYLSVRREASGSIQVKFKSDEIREQAELQLSSSYPELVFSEFEQSERYFLSASLSESALKEIKKSALKKNMLALRSRIDELGVSEPIIQQQGDSRIVVQLPGIQDTARAKDIIGKTATLEVRLVDEENSVAAAATGRVPFGSKLYNDRNGRPVLLKKRLIYSGDNIIDAGSGFDSQGGSPEVNITLDAKGAAINRDVTGKNLKKGMAVVYVENFTESKIVDGEEKIIRKKVEEVISVATIQDQLGKRFRITGLDSTKEAQDLALLLRAGSLAAPLYFVEERTVGPSLGKENIEKGFQSVLYGFLAVLVFMLIYYRMFGVVACVALVMNLVLIIAVLSLFQATLTLPGVAGMVLTVGMAVDANVLIFERIREELRNGSPPQMAIHNGYDNAFSTIIDANLTTLFAALVLFNFGTGPIQGFAITLSIGIITSMITAIFVSRILVNAIYGSRRLDKLAI